MANETFRPLRKQKTMEFKIRYKDIFILTCFINYGLKVCYFISLCDPPPPQKKQQQQNNKCFLSSCCSICSSSCTPQVPSPSCSVPVSLYEDVYSRIYFFNVVPKLDPLHRKEIKKEPCGGSVWGV